jgi:hypothetical protein
MAPVPTASGRVTAPDVPGTAVPTQRAMRIDKIETLRRDVLAAPGFIVTLLSDDLLSLCRRIFLRRSAMRPKKKAFSGGEIRCLGEYFPGAECMETREGM